MVDDVVLIDRNPRTTTGAVVVVDDLLSAARKIEILAVRLFIPLSLSTNLVNNDFTG